MIKFICLLLMSAVLMACNALPSRNAVLREAAQEAAPLEVMDADGRTSPRETTQIVVRAAGEGDSADELKQLILIEQALTGSPLVAGNRVGLLVDGPAAYQAMFAAIAQARDHVHLETFILADDAVGQRLADALIERRAAGVEVKVIYDSIGSADSPAEFFTRLETAGIEVHEFHPLDADLWRANHRDHRKLLIIDGTIAFTGGINISSVFSSSSSAPQASDSALESGWRDTQVRIEGPAVAEFQKLFLRIWADEEDYAGASDPRYYPPLTEPGRELVRVVASSGDGDAYDIYKAYVAAIALAGQRIWVTQAYFSPNATFLEVLKDAARRGVDVRILLPGFTDQSLVLYSSHYHYAELLESGIKLYERNDRLLHAKTAVIDGLWSTVGSSNLDYRSFLHNNEVNAVVIGHEFGVQMEQLFERDLAQAHQITLEEWRQRPLLDRIRETGASLFEYWF